MTPEKVHFYSKLPSVGNPEPELATGSPERIEPSTCTEAETFVLRVLDNSMQPEFRKGCIIVIDPTGLAVDGSFVLARSTQQNDSELADTDGYVFRQLKCNDDQQFELIALNQNYPAESTPSDLSRIVGVIVQRAGTRRSYHKHYD